MYARGREGNFPNKRDQIKDIVLYCIVLYCIVLSHSHKVREALQLFLRPGCSHVSAPVHTVYFRFGEGYCCWKDFAETNLSFWQEATIDVV